MDICWFSISTRINHPTILDFSINDKLKTTLSTLEPLCWIRSLSEINDDGVQFFLEHQQSIVTPNEAKFYFFSSTSHSTRRLLEPQAKKVMFLVFTLLNQPLISSLLRFMTVWFFLFYYSLQWEFHSFHGFSSYPYVQFFSTSVSLWCLANVLMSSGTCWSNWRTASNSTVICLQNWCDGIKLKLQIAVLGQV